MSYDERANARPNLNDESDVEEEAMVNDYREQVNFDDGMSELDRTTSHGGASQTQDLQAQLAAAATPLEYQATLETKFASYDNYCSLFHYILNSDGPVDLEVPSVGAPSHRPLLLNAMNEKKCLAFVESTAQGILERELI
jgi:translation initiation factor 3 subunit L